MDNLTKEQRHKNMKAIKSTDTKIELKLRKTLWHSGIRYRKKYKIFNCHPDIVITKYKIAIFCDGEFWHGKTSEKYAVSTNKEYWNEKIKRNVERDLENTIMLRDNGWSVIRFWEGDIMKDQKRCLDEILELICKKEKNNKPSELPSFNPLVRQFHRMKEYNNNYSIQYIKKDLKTHLIDDEHVKKSFEYAYSMTFGEEGKHRDHRSGGTTSRKYGEIFKDAFQGKLAECAVYEYLKDKFDISEPCFDVWGEGRWDEQDFVINGSLVSVKSTKKYGNLLLLETKDYDTDGSYIPNEEIERTIYRYIIMVRIAPSCEEIMKVNRLLYSNTISKQKLKELISSEIWVYDIPGYITNRDLKYIIENKFIIPKGARLNSSTVMDASNYYVQSGDLRDIDHIRV